jgi:hypothetical protein
MQTTQAAAVMVCQRHGDDVGLSVVLQAGAALHMQPQPPRHVTLTPSFSLLLDEHNEDPGDNNVVGLLCSAAANARASRYRCCCQMVFSPQAPARS